MTKYKIETDDLYTIKLIFFGHKYHSALIDIFNELRSKVKHSYETGSWDEAYKLVIDTLNDANIDLFDD